MGEEAHSGHLGRAVSHWILEHGGGGLASPEVGGGAGGGDTSLTASMKASKWGNPMENSLEECFKEIDEKVDRDKSSALKQIDELIPPNDRRIFTRANLIAVARAVMAGVSGSFWGKEFSGIPGAVTAAFVTAVLAASHNAIFKPITNAVFNASVKAAVGVMMEHARSEAKTLCP